MTSVERFRQLRDERDAAKAALAAAEADPNSSKAALQRARKALNAAQDQLMDAACDALQEV